MARKQESDRARRAAGISEQRSEKVKEGFARHAAQTANERQVTSQWESTREHGAETPEEKETRNGTSAILHFERGDFYTGLPHIISPSIH